MSQGRLRPWLVHGDNFLSWGIPHLNSLGHFCLLPFPMFSFCSLSLPPFCNLFFSWQVVKFILIIAVSEVWASESLFCHPFREALGINVFCIWHALMFLHKTAALWRMWRARQQEINGRIRSCNTYAQKYSKNIFKNGIKTFSDRVFDMLIFREL